MFKQHPNFGFEIINNNYDDEDIDPEDQILIDNAALFLDFRDGQDLEEIEKVGEVEKVLGKVGEVLGKVGEVGKVLGEVGEVLGKVHEVDPQHISTKPTINTKSEDFEDKILQLLLDLYDMNQINQQFDSLYEFCIRGCTDCFQQLLDAVENNDEIAESIQRIRCIIGIGAFIPGLSYDFYYVFSCCYDKFLATSSDWENYISQNFTTLANEIFTGTIFMQNDHTINIIMFPSNLTLTEKNIIHNYQIWGIQPHTNLLSDLDTLLQIDTELDDVGEELQIECFNSFIQSNTTLFPHLSQYSFSNHNNTMDKDQFENHVIQKFKDIHLKINSFLPKLIKKEYIKQEKILQQYLRPQIISPDFTNIQHISNNH